MNVLDREKAYKLKVLESLLRRLDENDNEWSFYTQMYATLKKGYEGEVRVDWIWQEALLPSNYFLLHNYETVNLQGYSHQIDTLLLTPHFIWLLEIKNISGRIDIDDSKHQLLRTNSDGTIDCFKNPVNQINRHILFLKKRLSDLKLKLPIETAIVIANDSTIIGLVPRDYSIFHASGIQRELNKLFSKYSKRSVSLQQLELLKNDLLSGYEQKKWKPKIESKKIKKGVLCPNCDYKSVMTFKYGNFHCLKCGSNSRTAYLEALLDYKNLFDEWISNRELREFLYIESQYAASRLLKGLNTEVRGASRNRMYKIPEVIHKDMGRRKG